MKNTVRAIGIVAGALLASSQVSAHHGASLFEAEKTVSFDGTVTDFQFVNPHVLIYMTVVDESGRQTQWAGELTSPNRLARMDSGTKWHKSILKPGDQITVTGHPARNGAPAMDITKIIDANGVVLIGDEG